MNTVDEVGKILREISEKDSGSLSTEDIMFALLNRAPCDRCAAIKISIERDEQKKRRELAESSNLTYYNQIHSNRSIIGRLIVLYRRIVRRLLRFLFLPILERQSIYNAQTAALLDAHCMQLNDIKTSISEIRTNVTEIKIDVAEMNRKTN